jgi:phospholipase/carboxylesterase
MTSDPAPDEGELHRDLAFAYRLHRPRDDTGEALVLLHGSGADETQIAPLGAAIAPRAVRVAVRGRIEQDGGTRWFRKITPTRFEQVSIRVEANAFAGFIAKLAGTHGLDLGRTVFVGYSNGANLVSSVMLLHPGLIGRAALLRAMPVLDKVPPSDLSDTNILVIAGAADDTYQPFAAPLAELLRGHGAAVDARTLPAGHEVGTEDARLVREWLAAAAAVS